MEDQWNRIEFYSIELTEFEGFAAGLGLQILYSSTSCWFVT